MQRQWFRFKAAANTDVAHLYVFDEIGKSIFGGAEGVTAQAFVAQLGALPAEVRTIHVHVNSYGGDPFDAIVIANALMEQRKSREVIVTIEGLAASAATIITCAGSPIRMASNALMMIHDPFMATIGNAEELRKNAAELDRIRDVIVATYQWVSNKSAGELAQMMAVETWMDAADALANGFATEIVDASVDVDEMPIAASILNRLKAPAAFNGRLAALVPRQARPESPVNILRLCTDAGVIDLASELISSQASINDVEARVSQERDRRTAAMLHATAVRNVCAMMKFPELAEGYIAVAAPLDTVKAHLLAISARLDIIEIDNHLHPDGASRQLSALPSSSHIYATRAKQARESAR